MKVLSAIHIRCKNCQLIRRGKQRTIRCTASPKHKQRQG